MQRSRALPAINPMLKTLSLLIPFTTLSVIVAQAAPNPTVASPKAGEIMLEGTVEKIDMVKLNIQLRATAFSTATGAKKQLPVAKSKLVQLSSTTQFLDASQGRTLILDDLEPGATVTLVGREGGVTKPFAARLISWTPRIVVKPDPLTPAAIVSLLPAPQSQGVFTHRVIDAGFRVGSKVASLSTKNPRPVFIVASTLADSSDTSQSWAGPKADQALRLVRISGPENQMLESIGSGPVHRGNGFYNGTIVGYTNVRAEWKSLTAEWELLDPAMPAKDSGKSESTLTFKNIPAPHEWDKPIPVAQELMTPQGAKVILEKVFIQKLPPTLPFKGTTFFQMRIVPPANNPGVVTKLELATNAVSNEDGTFWTVSSRGEGDNNIYIHSIPDENVKSINVTFKVKETAPAVIDSKWIHRFKQQIPVAALLKAMPIEKATESLPPVAQSQGQEASLEIERNMEWSDGWSGLLWIKSSGTNPPPMQHWLVRNAKATGDGGQKFDVWTYANDYDRVAWHTNGNPATPNERSNPIVVPFKGAKPTKIDIDFNLEAAQRVEKWDWLRNLPIPAFGESIDLPEGKFENDVMKVKRIFWFKNGDDLLGWSSGWRNNRRNGGLAIVVEPTPIFTGAEFNINKTLVFDERDRPAGANPTISAGDAGRAGTENSTLKTIILPQIFGTKTINLWMNTVENKWTGKTEKITLRDIAVP